MESTTCEIRQSSLYHEPIKIWAPSRDIRITHRCNLLRKGYTKMTAGYIRQATITLHVRLCQKQVTLSVTESAWEGGKCMAKCFSGYSFL